jgi:hypothetical protein
VQVTLTATDAPLFGRKSLLTVNVPLLSVFVIVHDAAPPYAIGTLRHGPWLAM